MRDIATDDSTCMQAFDYNQHLTKALLSFNSVTFLRIKECYPITLHERIPYVININAILNNWHYIVMTT